jgi:hypothetical protein
MKITTPAESYWNQRSFLHDRRERFHALQAAVNSPTDLSAYQWGQIAAFAREFAPDLVLELGRGYGNSTCVFLEVAQALPRPARVLSLCNTDFWARQVLPRVRQVVDREWLAPLQALETDILTFDYERAFSGFQRVLVFWDAHGFAVAECMLGGILPLIADRAHLVLMHDLSDARYAAPSSAEYGEKGLWKGGGLGRRLRIGDIDSAEEQAVAITDFASRNRLPLHSTDHSLHTELEADPARITELRERLGDLFSLQAHWFWFSLNEIPGPHTFPRYARRK